MIIQNHNPLRCPCPKVTLCDLVRVTNINAIDKATRIIFSNDDPIHLFEIPFIELNLAFTCSPGIMLAAGTGRRPGLSIKIERPYSLLVTVDEVTSLLLKHNKGRTGKCKIQFYKWDLKFRESYLGNVL